jgi:hypothetical protein
MITLSIIDKPISIFDRDREWADLVRFAESSTARLGVVYGRPRPRLMSSRLNENRLARRASWP